jgi:hypothetical protein
MNMQVVFDDSPSDSESAKYIASLPDWQQPVLRAFVEELLKSGRISHTDARRIENDRWSLWVRNKDGEAVNHICYLANADEPIVSDFAKELLNPSSKSSIPNTRSKRLMIVNANPGAVEGGQADPYLEATYYASLMDSVQRDVFLQTIDDIKNGRPSQSYSANGDGSFAIHINRPELAYGIHIECSTRWV